MLSLHSHLFPLLSLTSPPCVNMLSFHSLLFPLLSLTSPPCVDMLSLHFYIFPLLSLTSPNCVNMLSLHSHVFPDLSPSLTFATCIKVLSPHSYLLQFLSLTCQLDFGFDLCYGHTHFFRNLSLISVHFDFVSLFSFHFPRLPLLHLLKCCLDNPISFIFTLYLSCSFWYAVSLFNPMSFKISSLSLLLIMIWCLFILNSSQISLILLLFMLKSSLVTHISPPFSPNYIPFNFLVLPPLDVGMLYVHLFPYLSLTSPCVEVVYLFVSTCILFIPLSSYIYLASHLFVGMLSDH